MRIGLSEPKCSKFEQPYESPKTACGLELAKLFAEYAVVSKTNSPAVSEVWSEASQSLKRRYRDGVTTIYDRSAVMGALRLLHTLEFSPCTRAQAISTQKFIIEEFSLNNLTKQ